MNITEKILAKASGKNRVNHGEIVDANVDMVMVHDLTGPLAVEAFKKIGIKNVWDNQKVVVILDHQVPAESVKAAELHKTMRKFAKDQHLRIYDVGKGGICHQVMPEKGHVLPGTVIVGADSHTCTYGAFGAFATGIGSTEAGAGGAIYKSAEFAGPTIRAMSIAGRMTLCNMTVEMGAKNGIVEPDETTRKFLEGRTSKPFEEVKSDKDANYEKVVDFDVSRLEPVVACPSSVD